MATGVGTTHHIKLGNYLCIIRPNTYSKMPAPTFGARISTGDPNYNNLSIWQHWVQHCWVGGMGADEWVDDAMFKDAVGVDTTVHEKVTLSRHLQRGTGANWNMGGSADVARVEFIVWNSALWGIVWLGSGDGRIYKYDAATDGWTFFAAPLGVRVRSVAYFDGWMMVGGFNASNQPKLYRCYPSPSSWVLVVPPAGVTSGSVRAMRQYNGRLYVAFETHVWRLKLDMTWDGGTEFYVATANSGSNYLIQFEVHLGFLYMLSQNGHLHRTDGNNTFDIWSWDGQTSGVSLRSYDGKLFVGTYEYTDTIDVGFGVLYQFTGAAVTELKRWGVTGRSTTIGSMIVYARRLFYGASGLFGVRPGFGIACYDSVEDGHSIFAMNDDVTSFPDTTGTGGSWLVDDVVVFGGKMFCAVRGHGVFYTPDSFKDVEKGLARFSTSASGGVLTTSLYDGGTPGLQKLWRRITVWCDLPWSTTYLKVEYSLDVGKTWVAFPQVNGPSTDGQFNFYLNNVRDPQFQLRITLRTTDATTTPTLRSFAVSYLPQPEPNWMWTFVIPVTDKWELLDKTIVQNDTNALLAYVEDLFRTQQLFGYIDIDGVPWASNGPGVLLYDMNIMHYDIEQPREADLRITLLEAVESY